MGLKHQSGILLSHYPSLAHHMDEAGLELLAEGEVSEFPPHTTMFHEAEPCRNFMWLLEGSVRVYKHSGEGREVTLYRVQPGELCLLSLNSLLAGHSYPATAISESRIHGLVIPESRFHHLMERSPGFRNYVLQTLTERLTEMISLISDVTFRRLDLRLACLLGQRFERSHGKPLRVTHAALAHELGTTREVISRILKEFERQECIRLSRGQIHLLSQAGLDDFSRPTLTDTESSARSAPPQATVSAKQSE